LKNRVVVTGVGMVTPLGTGVEKNWASILQGRSGIGPVTRFDASQLKCQVAGEVKDFHPEDFMDQKFISHFDPFVQYGMAAAIMAVDDSGINNNKIDHGRFGVVIGTGAGANTVFEVSHTAVVQGMIRKVPPYFMINNASNCVTGAVAIRFQAKGPNHCPAEACATGTNAIGLAFRLIQWGEADVVIAGGSDDGITPTCMASLDLLGALTSKRNKEPEKASRPFDGDRDGFVTGEGGGIVILEALDSALSRGAEIYGEVIGYGNNCDAYHFTSPSPGGEEQAACMRLALKDAGISPEQVDYINAHGTSTVLNDVSETKAIKKAFGAHARRLAISSNKSMTGHLWAASGTVEAVFTLLAMREGVIPPTINQEVSDPECDLDYVPNHARKAEVSVAISNSFGFGGVNGTLVFRRFSESHAF